MVEKVKDRNTVYNSTNIYTIANRNEAKGNEHTVRPLVGIIVESAIWISIALQLFGYAKRAVCATEVEAAIIAIVTADQSWNLHLRPDCPEAFTAGHFIGGCESNYFHIKIIPNWQIVDSFQLFDRSLIFLT